MRLRAVRGVTPARNRHWPFCDIIYFLFIHILILMPLAGHLHPDPFQIKCYQLFVHILYVWSMLWCEGQGESQEEQDAPSLSHSLDPLAKPLGKPQLWPTSQSWIFWSVSIGCNYSVSTLPLTWRWQGSTFYPFVEESHVILVIIVARIFMIIEIVYLNIIRNLWWGFLSLELLRTRLVYERQHWSPTRSFQSKHHYASYL